jgi:hypothetical protein
VSHSVNSKIATIEAERRRLRGYLAVPDRVAHKMEAKQEG